MCREDEGIVDIQGVVGLVSSELTELTSSSFKASKKEDDLKVTYEYIQKYKSSYEQLVELTEINGLPSYRQLRSSEEQIERKFNELSKRYGPKNPKYIAVNAELISIKENIRRHVSEIAITIEKNSLAAVEKVKTNNSRL